MRQERVTATGLHSSKRQAESATKMNDNEDSVKRALSGFGVRGAGCLVRSGSGCGVQGARTESRIRQERTQRERTHYERTQHPEPNPPNPIMILAGDIGGTKTFLGLFEAV